MGDFVEYVNSNNFTWKANFHPRFEGIAFDDISSRGKIKSTEAIKRLTATNSIDNIATDTKGKHKQTLNTSAYQAA
jgi:hypothetical protein